VLIYKISQGIRFDFIFVDLWFS